MYTHAHVHVHVYDVYMCTWLCVSVSACETLYLYVCSCAWAHFMWVHMYMCIHACTWSKVSLVGCFSGVVHFPQVLLIFFSETGSLTSLGLWVSSSSEIRSQAHAVMPVLFRDQVQVYTAVREVFHYLSSLHSPGRRL